MTAVEFHSLEVLWSPERKGRILHGKAKEILRVSPLAQVFMGNMGTNVIAGKCCPYICLLGQLLKGGGAKTSESKLLGLFQTSKKHCV